MSIESIQRHNWHSTLFVFSIVVERWLSFGIFTKVHRVATNGNGCQTSIPMSIHGFSVGVFSFRPIFSPDSSIEFSPQVETPVISLHSPSSSHRSRKWFVGSLKSFIPLHLEQVRVLLFSESIDRLWMAHVLLNLKMAHYSHDFGFLVSIGWTTVALRIICFTVRNFIIVNIELRRAVSRAFVAWSFEPSERMLIAFSTSPLFDIYLPIGSFHFFVSIRDKQLTATEYNLTSVLVQSDRTTIQDLSKNLSLAILAFGNQNTIAQIVTSISQDLNQANDDMMNDPVSSACRTSTISLYDRSLLFSLSRWNTSHRNLRIRPIRFRWDSSAHQREFYSFQSIRFARTTSPIDRLSSLSNTQSHSNSVESIGSIDWRNQSIITD